MYKPILVFCFPALSINQLKAVQYRLEGISNESGWLCIAVDGFDKMDIKAFGVPESKLEEWDALKKQLENKLAE